ncbi:MAG: hypothetical protein F7C33_03795 [Desulfurococcales archaeon]|nr:hypothetical protein [Desulfurococcales archaeon]
MALLGLTGVLLVLRGSLEASSLLGLTAIVASGIFRVNGIVPGLALLGFTFSLLVHWVHREACGRGLRLLGVGVGVSGYALSLSWVLHRWGVHARYLPSESLEALSSAGGFTILIATSTLFFSLTVYYSLRPSSSLPSIASIARWLCENRTAPIEALVYSLFLASLRASPFVALLGFVSAGLGVWAWSLTRRREAVLLTVVLSYVFLVWLTGYYRLVNDYLLRLLQ